MWQFKIYVRETNATWKLLSHCNLLHHYRVGGITIEEKVPFKGMTFTIHMSQTQIADYRIEQLCK